MTTYNINSVYSFDVYPTAFLGTDFENVTVLAILDWSTANTYIDVQAEHIQVYPTLPVGTPNDPKTYNYLKLKLASGETRVIGIPWIVDSSVVLVNLQVMTLKVNVASTDDQNMVINALAANGFTVLDYTLS